jgi:glutamyl/glutaminyl-tRNA synthetase
MNSLTQSRFVEGAVENIKESLKWAGIYYNEGPDKGGPYGPYIQSHRKQVYKAHAEKLVQNGLAYPCFCSEERLASLRGKGTHSGNF